MLLNPHPLKNLMELSQALDKKLIFLDLETTGLLNERNFSIIEIGLVVISHDQVLEKSALVDPEVNIPEYITELTGISNDMVAGKKKFLHFNSFFQKASSESILCGYNSKSFDSKAVEKKARDIGFKYSFSNQLDIRYLFLRNRNALLKITNQRGNLSQACEFYKTPALDAGAHRAAADIANTALLAENILHYHGLECVIPDIKKMADKDIFLNKLNSFIAEKEKANS